MSRPVIVIGGGGHAGVVIDLLRLREHEVVGVVDPALVGSTDHCHGVELLGDDSVVISHDSQAVALANGVGSTASTDGRAAVFQKFSNKGYAFLTLVHPSAVVASNVKLGEGCQVMAGAVLQCGVTLAGNVLVNTRAAIDHDCRIGANVHVAPGATLSGNVVVEDDVHIGTGAVVVQSVTIGRGSHIGAGAVAAQDLPAKSLVRAPDQIVKHHE